MRNGVNDINIDEKALAGLAHLSKKEIQKIVAEKFEYFSSLIKYSKNSGLKMAPFQPQNGEEGTFACGLGEEGNDLFGKFMEGKIEFSDIPEEYFEPKYLYYWLPWLIEKDNDVLGPIIDHELEHAESSDYGDMLVNSREAAQHGLPVTSVGMFFNAFEDIYMGKKQIAKGRAKRLGVQNLYKDMFTTTGTVDARGKLSKLDQFANKVLHYWLSKEFPQTFDTNYVVDEDVQEEFDQFIEHLDEIVDTTIDNKERLKKKNETLWPIIDRLGKKDMDRLQRQRIKQQIQKEHMEQQQQQIQKAQENTQGQLQDALNKQEGNNGAEQKGVKEVREGTQENIKDTLNQQEGNKQGENNSNNKGQGEGQENKESEGKGNSEGNNGNNEQENNSGEGNNESKNGENKDQNNESNSGGKQNQQGNNSSEGNNESENGGNQGKNDGSDSGEKEKKQENKQENMGNMPGMNGQTGQENQSEESQSSQGSNQGGQESNGQNSSESQSSTQGASEGGQKSDGQDSPESQSNNQGSNEGGQQSNGQNSPESQSNSQGGSEGGQQSDGQDSPESQSNNQGSNEGGQQSNGQNSPESQSNSQGGSEGGQQSDGQDSPESQSNNQGGSEGNNQGNNQLNNQGSQNSQSSNSHSSSGSSSDSPQSSSSQGGDKPMEDGSNGLGISESELEKEIEDRLQNMSEEEKNQMMEQIKNDVDAENLKEHGDDLRMQKKLLDNKENNQDSLDKQLNGKDSKQEEKEKKEQEKRQQKELEEMQKQWEDIEKAVEKRQEDLDSEKKIREYMDKLEEMTHEKDLSQMEGVEKEYENLKKQADKLESEDIKQQLKDKLDAMKEYLKKKERDYEKELAKSGFSREEEYLYKRYMKIEKEMDKSVDKFIKKLETDIPKLKEYHLEGGFSSGRVTDMNEAGRKVRLKQRGEKLYSRYEEKESLEVNLGICLSVDVSGSMSYNMGETMKLVIFLGLLCQKWGIPFHVNTFGDSLHIIKDTDDEFEERKGTLMRELVADAGWTNIGLSVQKDLEVIKEVEKTHPDTVFLPIFISDGASNRGILGRDLIELMKGFNGLSTMVGIGVSEYDLKQWYPDSTIISLDSSSEIMTTLLKELRHFFKKHKSKIFKAVTE